MKVNYLSIVSFWIGFIPLTGLVSPLLAQIDKVEYAKDGSGTYGFREISEIQPWSGYYVHDPDRPAPPIVEPGTPVSPSAPSDALVLFNGAGLSQWEPSKWVIDKGDLIATEGLITTKREFGDCQMHLEWQAPVERVEKFVNQGNSGVLFLGEIEVQIFDSYSVKVYPDGKAAAIYGQTPPLVNAARRPGQWQTYDIVFTAPRFDATGKRIAPARITMFHNGLLVHHYQEVYGDTSHRRVGSYKGIAAVGPISLMSHHCPVRFRNIWIRDLTIWHP
jgi:hypothetical protein